MLPPATELGDNISFYRFLSSLTFGLVAHCQAKLKRWPLNIGRNLFLSSDKMSISIIASLLGEDAWLSLRIGRSLAASLIPTRKSYDTP